VKIFFIGKFVKMYDEEYIARSFEFLGHEVLRCEQSTQPNDIGNAIDKFKPDIVLYTKWERPPVLDKLFEIHQRRGMTTVCWLFDLYWGYPREYQIQTKKFFKSDFVFTTDGGHDLEWKMANVNHRTVRQGIYKNECYMLPVDNYVNNVVFVGSENPMYQERTNTILLLQELFTKFKWVGRHDTDETRSTSLNELYAETKIVVGDSYPSPRYWSNRVVETLGRGGFLIHRDVEGIKKEYPHLVTYNGTIGDLKNKIKYYLEHDKEREEIRQMNFQWVKDRYTMDKKCEELINHVNQA
jgi:hypothetical protein